MSPPDDGRDEEGTFDARVQGERDQIFKAMSIVDCCRYASASLYPCDDPEFMVPALEAAHDLLNDVVEELETIATRSRVPPRRHPEDPARERRKERRPWSARALPHHGPKVSRE